jgi:hypothetical protein
MPRPTTLTSQQKTDIRANAYQRMAFVLKTPQSIVFQATVQDAISGLDYAEIDYDTPSTGAYTDIELGQTVLVHRDSSDIDDLLFPPTYARDAATADVVKIGWQATNLLGTDTITVLDDYRLHVRQVRTTGNTLFIDYDDVFNSLAPAIYGLQSVYAIHQSSAASIDFAPTVEAMASGASIASYLWDVGDGSITTGTSASKDITVSFPAWTSGETSGWRWVSLTATDSNGISSNFRFQVFVGDFYSAAWVVTDIFTLDIGSDLESGLIASITVGASAANFYKDNHLTVAIVENKNGDSDPIVSNIAFVGRVKGYTDDAVAQLIGDIYGIQIEETVSYEVQGYAYELENLPLPEYQLENVASASDWNEVTDLNIPRAIWYILYYLTTAPTIIGFDLDSSTWGSYENVGFSFDNGTVLQSVNRVASLIGCNLIFARSGEAYLSKDARLLGSAARDLLDSAANFIDDDLLSSIQHREPPQPRIGHVEVVVSSYSTTSGKETLLQTIAPKIPNTTGEAVRYADFLVASDQTSENIIAEAATLTANYLAIKNEASQITVTILDGYWFLIADNSAWVDITHDFLSSLSYDSNTRWVIQDISLSVQPQLDEATGRIWQEWTVAITLSKETSDEGIANAFKFAPNVQPYTVPSNPTVPQYGIPYDPSNAGDENAYSGMGATISYPPVDPPFADPNYGLSPSQDAIVVPIGSDVSVPLNKTTIASNNYLATVTGHGVISTASEIVDFEGGYPATIVQGSVPDGFASHFVLFNTSRVIVDVNLGVSSYITGVTFDMLTINASPGGYYDPKYKVTYYDSLSNILFTTGDVDAGIAEETWSEISVSQASSNVLIVRVEVTEISIGNSTESRLDNIAIGGFTGGTTRADAFYSYGNTGGGSSLGASGGLFMNGVKVPLASVNPFAYNSAHSYQFSFTGTGIAEVFNFEDSDYSDNSGNLNLLVEGVFA